MLLFEITNPPSLRDEYDGLRATTSFIFKCTKHEAEVADRNKGIIKVYITSLDSNKILNIINDNDIGLTVKKIEG